MIIQNRDELATTELRGEVLDILEVGIDRVLPRRIMREAVRVEDGALVVNGERFPFAGRVFVIGGGKASGAMAEELERILGPDRIVAGVVSCKDDAYQTARIRVIAAGHPEPDRRGVEAVRRMLALKAEHGIGADDLVICLISGGGSALMPAPAEELTLTDLQQMTRLLLSSGATIHEMNVVRKHLSNIKGGGLAENFSPARVVSLIISDVVGNDIDVIASGITAPDASTYADAFGILEKHGIREQSPAKVIAHLQLGQEGELPETPTRLDNARNIIIGDNMLALRAMDMAARGKGFSPLILTAEQAGDTATVAQERAQEIIDGKQGSHDLLILGGETAPALPPVSGVGGRNQHYCLVTLEALRGRAAEWVCASVGTDGSDYVEDVAGAIVDGSQAAEADMKGLDIKSSLEHYDSGTFLASLGSSLVRTGPTGTNVCDIVVYALSRPC
ncbi:DUF4147 domain-containing protein [Candidatus Woesearchaeota archaeon]|nr:DUF4147 domain-containing protein [Candidatus Woesearchaeota archaeon]